MQPGRAGISSGKFVAGARDFAGAREDKYPARPITTPRRLGAKSYAQKHLETVPGGAGSRSAPFEQVAFLSKPPALRLTREPLFHAREFLGEPERVVAWPSSSCMLSFLSLPTVFCAPDI
jgi:hypothetical protein